MITITVYVMLKMTFVSSLYKNNIVFLITNTYDNILEKCF